MPVVTENPFAKPIPVNNWSKDQIDNIEEASRRAFFEQRGPGSR
jgi:hypothetical protein